MPSCPGFSRYPREQEPKRANVQVHVSIIPPFKLSTCALIYQEGFNFSANPCSMLADAYLFLQQCPRREQEDYFLCQSHSCPRHMPFCLVFQPMVLPWREKKTKAVMFLAPRKLPPISPYLHASNKAISQIKTTVLCKNTVASKSGFSVCKE